MTACSSGCATGSKLMRRMGGPSNESADIWAFALVARARRHNVRRLLAYGNRTRPILAMEAARCCCVTLILQAFKHVSQNTPDRYSRQTRFAPFGSVGQAELGRSTAVIVGCGAL